MQVIPTGPGAATACRRALAANHLLCLLSDRLVGGAAGVEVEFFGERTQSAGRPGHAGLADRGRRCSRARCTSRPVAAGVSGFIRPPLQLPRAAACGMTCSTAPSCWRRAGSADPPGPYPVAPDAAQLALGYRLAALDAGWRTARLEVTDRRVSASAVRRVTASA